MPGWKSPRELAAGTQQITELGDPDFSPSTSSQGQVPGAAAQKVQFQNQRSSRNFLDTAVAQGFDTSREGFDPIRQQAEQGFKEEALSFVGELVGWIDGPRQAINLLIQDIVGGEAEGGFRNPNFGDYWNVMWGGLEDAEGFKLATGLEPISGSKTLDMFGWELEDDLGGRIGRGIADFGLQVLTDPLTYVTFGLSGLGKKMALSASNELAEGVTEKLVRLATSEGAVAGKTALQETLEAGGKGLTKYEKHLASNMDELVDDFWRDMTQHYGADGVPADAMAAFNRWVTGSADEVFADPEKIAKLALINRIGSDVTQPLVARDFKKIHKLALDDLPAYARGGARISVPFTKNTLKHGRLIPGTQGLGRKIGGDPLRSIHEALKKKFRPVAHLSESVRKATTNMDQMAPLLRAWRNGDIEGWQWGIAAGAIDQMTTNSARHTISTVMNSHWNTISDLAEEAGVDLSAIGTDILLRLEGDAIDDVLLQQIRRAQDIAPGKLGFEAVTTNKPLDRAVKTLVNYMQETMNEYHAGLSALDPSFKDKFIKGYIPHSPTKEGRGIITALAGEATGKGGTGIPAEDMFAYILNAAGHGGAAEPLLGANRYAIDRGVGRVQSLQLVDDGVLMVDDEALRTIAQVIPPIEGGVVNPKALQTGYMSTQQLNQQLEGIVRREYDRLGLALPSNWDGKLFNENAIETMIDYVDSMTDAINAWSITDKLKASGLAFKHSTALDMQSTIQRMFNNSVRAAADFDATPTGRPRRGEITMAPRVELERLIQKDDYQRAIREVDSGTHETLRESILRDGITTPVQIGVKENGDAALVEGHHRLLIAADEGIDDVPVQWLPVTDDAFDGAAANYADRMKEGWWEGASGKVAAERAANVERILANKPRKEIGAYDSFDAVTELPWKPVPVTSKSILRGGANQSPVAGVPMSVYTEMTDAGFVVDDIYDVAEARELVNFARSSHPGQWADDVTGGIDDMIGPQFDGPTKLNVWERSVDENGVVHLGFRAEKVRGQRQPPQPKLKRQQHSVKIEARPGLGDVKPRIRIMVDPALKGAEKRTARRVALNWLDRAFKEGGDLDGLLTKQGYDELIESGMTEETAELVRTHVMAKLGAMDKETVEFLSREPAEIVRLEALYQSWEAGYKEMVEQVSAIRASDGSTIIDPEAIELLGTAETVKKLEGLKRAALTLGDNGYDMAAEVMRDVDVYTGVSLHKGFVNPEMFNLAGPAIGDLQMHHDVAEWLSLTAKNMGSIYTPEGIAAAKLATNETLKWWRAMATLPRPAFHIRNLVGGSWMNLNFGVRTKTMAAVSTNGIKFRNALNLRCCRRDSRLHGRKRGSVACWQDSRLPSFRAL
jgi:hypothetical protein